MIQAIKTLSELAASEGLSAMSAKHAGDAGLKAAVHGMQAASLLLLEREDLVLHADMDMGCTG